ncbi:MAG TPA: hypothetical protein VMS96_15410, partial [Terriglobales bacterium]|nr:hypothetical protein [Terriglobales bacterium]
VGLVGECSRSDRWKKHVRIFEMCVIIGVAGELLADGGIFLFSRHLQKIADEELAQVTKEAGIAKVSAKEAAGAASRAETAAGNAGNLSDRAATSAGNALELARGARQEADSFEKDIISAKKQAAEAESHLAEALKQAVEAKAELNRLKSPRTLANIPELISVLGAFKGAKYRFSGVFGDEEAGSFLLQINGALENAGWIRVKTTPPGMEPYMGITTSRNEQIPVRYTIGTGVRIWAASRTHTQPKRVLGLGCENAANTPELRILEPSVRAALTLSLCLSSHTSPMQEFQPVMIERESSDPDVVKIEVGKKP